MSIADDARRLLALSNQDESRGVLEKIRLNNVEVIATTIEALGPEHLGFNVILDAVTAVDARTDELVAALDNMQMMIKQVAESFLE